MRYLKRMTPAFFLLGNMTGPAEFIVQNLLSLTVGTTNLIVSSLLDCFPDCGINAERILLAHHAITNLYVVTY